MNILVTRPMADAVPFAKLLSEAGHEVVVEPMIRIRPVPVLDDDLAQTFAGVTGLVFTSANGVRTLAERSDIRDITAWCVGKASAQAAHDAGFQSIETAGGDVNMLADHISACSAPADGPLLHIAGSHRAGDLSALLSGAGYDIRRLVLYEAEARQTLTEQTRHRLKAGDLDVLTLFSPRTSKMLRDLVATAGVQSSLADVTLLSLSGAVDRAFDIPVRRRVISDDRHQGSVLTALNNLESEPS